MSKVLIVAEHLGGKLNASTAKCVSAAQALSPESIDIVVLAADPAGVAAEAAQIAGVAKVITVANPANEHAIAQVLAPQVAKLADESSRVILVEALRELERRWDRDVHRFYRERLADRYHEIIDGSTVDTQFRRQPDVDAQRPLRSATAAARCLCHRRRPGSSGQGRQARSALPCPGPRT
mgnify:CR=1 FL=1